MSKEAMIKVLRYKAEHIKTKIKPGFFAEVADMLEQEPCEDAVSRKDIYFKLTNGAYPNENIEQFIGRLVKELKALQPVTPEPKTGHWIFDYVSADGHRVYHCSECGCYLKPKHSEPLETFKYCSLCGAWMIEPQESEDKECRNS